ncbi:MAG: beta-propeller domain-containing protein, partial [Flavobacteriales bacterium]|nr:beta-propeller domain-containing protein [Flavobacteriales bacterium]
GVMEPVVEVPDVDLPEDWPPTASRSVASPHLLGYDGCDDLEASLKASIEEEYRTQLLQAVEEQYRYWGGDIFLDAEMAMDDGAADASTNSPTTRTEGTDYSGTNNQEQGVDEADFVKTDGHHIYFLQGQRLHIFGVPTFGELVQESNLSLEGTPRAMMLDGDQLVVISTLNPWAIQANSPVVDAMGWDEEYNQWRTSSLTKFTVLNVADGTDAVVDRELYIEGQYITARETNGTVRTVTHAWMDVRGMTSWLSLPNGYYNLDWEDDAQLRRDIRERVAYKAMQANQNALDNLSLNDLIPQVYEFTNGEVTTHRMSDDACAQFVAPEDGFNRGITSIFALELSSASFAFTVDHVVGNYPQVYASQDVLVLAENAFDWWWFWGTNGVEEMTNLHTFDISSPDATLYTGSGRVNGTVLNQFSLSEFEGVLRVATTTGQWGQWWLENPEPMSSQLVTLGRSVDLDTQRQVLVETGRVDGIAPGERIWSARFDGDRAYLVTFEQIDPLWVIDISNATDPVILGELEVPGVSTYIHPLSRDHLLTIGMGPANEDGTGLDWSSTQLSLFNIQDPTAPTRDDVLRIAPVQDDDGDGWQWSWSEASYESKAFQYWAPKQTLAVPLSTYRSINVNEDGRYGWTYEYVSKLMLVNVDETNGTLSVHGEVNHSSLFSDDQQRYWWNDQSIRRSIFMGDFVYALSAAGITATKLETLEETARITIPHERQYDAATIVSDEPTD